MKLFSEKLLKREAELHLREDIVIWHPLKNSGSTNASFFASSVSGKSFTVKYNYICNATLQQIKIRKLIDSGINLVFPKLICSFISLSFPFHICFITEWIEGDALDICELNDNQQELFMCACKVSQKLKTIHTAEKQFKLSSRSLKRDYKKALREIRFHHIDVPHLADFVSYIDKNIDECAPVTKALVHFDFHPGNIIKQGDDYRIVDLETLCIAEPWRDLVYATEINFPDQHKFWLLFLLSYFDGEFPCDYFMVSKIYVLVYMLMLAKQNKNNGFEMYCKLVNKVYEDYNKLQSNIPAWIIKTSAELYESTELFKDTLSNILESSNYNHLI